MAQRNIDDMTGHACVFDLLFPDDQSVYGSRPESVEKAGQPDIRDAGGAIQPQAVRLLIQHQRVGAQMKRAHRRFGLYHFSTGEQGSRGTDGSGLQKTTTGEAEHSELLVGEQKEPVPFAAGDLYY